MSDRNQDNAGAEFQSGQGNTEPNTHWSLLGRLIAFQFKLAMDGLRDLLLSPVSIGFVLYGIVVQRDQPEKYFERLMRFGRDTDKFINLFGDKHANSTTQTDLTETDEDTSLVAIDTENTRSRTSDDYVRKLESLILSEYKKGGVISELKQSTDGILEKLQSKAERSRQKHIDIYRSSDSDLE